MQMIIGRKRRGASIADRLERLSIPEPMSGCKIWLGATNEQGYGKMTVAGHSEQAHRLAVKDAGRELPDDMLALHHCDNTLCIEERHIYAGTHKQNTADMMKRGRYSPPPIGMRGQGKAHHV